MGTHPHADAPVARVDHVANAVDGQRRLRNVGRHNDLARGALGRLENLRAPGVSVRVKQQQSTYTMMKQGVENTIFHIVLEKTVTLSRFTSLYSMLMKMSDRHNECYWWVHGYFRVKIMVSYDY